LANSGRQPRLGDMTASSPDPEPEPSESTYQRLVALLDEHDADYELIDHEPVGITDVVSALRGNPLEQAAKCLLLMVKVDRRTRRYVLAVVPGDAKVDLGRVASRYAARYAGFCDPATAEQLARTVPGTVLPFAMDPSVELLVDPRVLDQPRLYFNAARLDRSVSLSTADYAAIARPQVAEIAGIAEIDHDTAEEGIPR
jgi:Ala-tRNA(Pro) deacylase